NRSRGHVTAPVARVEDSPGPAVESRSTGPFRQDRGNCPTIERSQMPDGQVLEFDRVTKRFGDVAAVSDFSARVSPGVVTGFLGPNGAGKTTTLRVLMGAVRPTSGTAT